MFESSSSLTSSPSSCMMTSFLETSPRTRVIMLGGLQSPHAAVAAAHLPAPAPSSGFADGGALQSRTAGRASPAKASQISLHGVSIVSLVIDSKERLCLAQISNTLLKRYSYNEIHNRRVALGITCVQCTPVQLEVSF